MALIVFQLLRQALPPCPGFTDDIFSVENILCLTLPGPGTQLEPVHLPSGGGVEGFPLLEAKVFQGWIPVGLNLEELGVFDRFGDEPVFGYCLGVVRNMTLDEIDLLPFPDVTTGG